MQDSDQTDGTNMLMKEEIRLLNYYTQYVTDEWQQSERSPVFWFLVQQLSQ